jgi:ABC-type multidrug transport system fused ATPase/permease subunit
MTSRPSDRPQADLCRIYEASFGSQLFFHWVFPLLVQGYRAGTVVYENLGNLSGADHPEYAFKILDDALRGSPAIGGTELSKGWTLLRMLMCNFSHTIVMCGLMLLISQIAGIAALYLLKVVLDLFIGMEGQLMYALSLAILLIALKFIESLFEHQFWIYGIRAGMRVQAALVANCCRKALNLSSTSRSTYDVGEITTLMTIDARKGSDVKFWPYLHWGSWGSLIPIAVALVSLHGLIGNASFIAFATLLMQYPLSALVSTKIKEYSLRMQEKRGERATIVGDTLRQIRLVKASNWESLVSDLIHGFRECELKELRKYQLTQGLLLLLVDVVILVTPIVSFAYYSYMEDGLLDSATVFASLAWFEYMKRAIRFIASAPAIYSEHWASLVRLQSFFMASERVDADVWLQDMSARPNPKQATGSATEKVERNPTEALSAVPDVRIPQTHIRLQNASFGWMDERTVSTPQKSQQDLMNKSQHPTERSHLRQSFSKTDLSSESGIVLSNMNLEVKSGEVVFLIGPVGSGKSTLLMGLLREATLIKEPDGSTDVSIEGSTAFVSDQPWVSNRTIRDNIIFGSPFDSGRYDAVLTACCLKHDLQALEYGDMTEVGERGVNLSGGQRQRVNIARAVYAQADIIILDDCFSALDVHVGSEIFDNCFGARGLCKDAIRIVVTHQHHLLRKPGIDRVYVLSRGGGIIAQGSPKDILTSKNHQVQSILQAFDQDSRPVTDIAGQVMQASQKEKAFQDGEETGVSASSVKAVGSKQLFVQEERQEDGAIKLGFIFSYLRSCGAWSHLPLMGFALIADGGISILQSLFYGYITAHCEPTHGITCSDRFRDHVFMTMTEIVSILLLVRVIRVIVIVFGSLTASKILHDRLVDSLVSAKTYFFDTQLSGRILNRVVADIAAIDLTVPVEFNLFIKSFLALLSTAVIVLINVPYTVVGMLLILVPYYYIYEFYRWPARDLKRLDSIARSPINSHITEVISGLTTIRAFGCQALAMREHLQHATESCVCFWHFWCANQWMTTALETLGIALFGVVCICCITGVYFGHLSASAASLVMSFSLNFPSQLGWVLKSLCSAEVEAVALERISEYSSLAAEDPSSQAHDTAYQCMSPVIPLIDPKPSSGGAVVFRDVSLHYGPEEDTSAPTVLKHLSLHIKAGEKVAICGRTGAGKSTVFQALLRFYQYTGSILVDGSDIGMMSYRESRDLFAYIPQEALLIGRTFRQALLGQCCEDPQKVAKMWELIDRFHLRERITALGGVDVTFKQSDDGLSSGERQLLCAIRAMLRPCQVLLCDEMSSALDHNVDNAIHDVILEDSRTVISIMHRLAHANRFDKVVVMHNGSVAECGSPHELLSTRGLFNAMLSAQN